MIPTSFLFIRIVKLVKLGEVNHWFKANKLLNVKKTYTLYHKPSTKNGISIN